MQGKTIARQNIEAAQGVNQISLSMAGLAEGIYNLTLGSNEDSGVRELSSGQSSMPLNGSELGGEMAGTTAGSGASGLALPGYGSAFAPGRTLTSPNRGAAAILP